MSEGIAVRQQLTEQGETVAPYPPSWVDRLITRVRDLPGPSWLPYLAAWLALFLLETAVKWADGSYPVGTIFPFHLPYTGYPVGCVALIYYLDYRAGRALAAFRPTLIAGEAEYADLRYRLTVLPARRTLLASVAGAVLAGPIFLLTQSIFPPLKLATSPLSVVLDGALFLATWCMIGVFTYHTLHQLTLVNRIYTTYTRIDLYQLGPLYAFSGLTARTAIGWIVLLSAWHTPVPQILSQPGSLAVILSLMLVAAVTFAWPLVGVHALLQAEKARLQGEAAERMKAALRELHRQVDEGALNAEAATALNNTLNSLAAEENRLAKIPTWPWRSEMLSAVGTAVLIPFVLWIVEQILLRVAMR